MKYMVWYLNGEGDYRKVTFRKGIAHVCRYGRWIELREERGMFWQITPIDFNDGANKRSTAATARLLHQATINVNSVAEHLGMRA
jgi:hypothetical protein